MKDEVRIAAISLTSSGDKGRNIAQAEVQVRKAAEFGAEWIQLPEMLAYHGPYSELYGQAEFEDGPLNKKWSALARELKVVLFAGTVGEKPKDAEGGSGAETIRRIFNTQYVFGRDGALAGKYRKIHLFNLVGQEGRPSYCESEGFLPGKEFVRLEIEGFKVGLATCYDLRFPEFFIKLAGKDPLDVIAIPSAFTQQTGMDHWELLLRARAVEFQCYVFAANQTGTHSPGKVSYGHSMIVDPWGHKLADTGNLPGIAFGTISKSRIASYRAQLPALQNRRYDIY